MVLRGGDKEGERRTRETVHNMGRRSSRHQKGIREDTDGLEASDPDGLDSGDC